MILIEDPKHQFKLVTIMLETLIRVINYQGELRLSIYLNLESIIEVLSEETNL